MQAKLGNKWAEIAKKLQGRTDNDVKNWWSTRQKRLRNASAAAGGAAGELPLQQQQQPRRPRSVLPSSSALPHGLRSLKLKGAIYGVGESSRQQPDEMLCIAAGPADAVKESNSGADLIDAPLPLPLPLPPPPPVSSLLPLLPSWPCRRRGSVGQSVLPSSSALSHGLSSLKLKGQICEAGQSSRPQPGPANNVKDESDFGADLVDTPLPLAVPIAATAEPSSGPGLASLHGTVTSSAPTHGLDDTPQGPSESNATTEGTEQPVTYSSLEPLFASHMERVARVSDEARTFGMDKNNAIPSFTAVKTEPPRTYHRKVPFGADLNAMPYQDFIKPLSSDKDNPFVVQEPPFPKPYAEPYAETGGTTQVRFNDWGTMLGLGVPQEPNESNAAASGTEPPVTYSKVPSRVSFGSLFSACMESQAQVPDEPLTFFDEAIPTLEPPFPKPYAKPL